MVVGAFPAAKLGSLLLKQVSKPIANLIKSRAKTSPVFRTYVCMPPAQFYNWCEVQTKMWILNLGKPVNIPVLNEAMAIELGANLLGEGIIFVIAAGALIAEYQRSSNKEAAKEAAKEEEMSKLNSVLMELYLTTEQQATEIRELRRIVYDLDSRVVQKPWVPKKESNLPESDPPKPKPPPSGIILGLSNSSPVRYSNEALPLKGGPLEMSSAETKAKSEVRNSTRGLVLNAIHILEDDVFHRDEERIEGVLTSAINHFYKEVYKVPLSV